MRKEDYIYESMAEEEVKLRNDPEILRGNISKVYMDVESLVMILDGKKIVGFKIEEGFYDYNSASLEVMTGYNIHEYIDHNVEVLNDISAHFPEIEKDYNRIEKMLKDEKTKQAEEAKKKAEENAILQEEKRKKDEYELFLSLKKKYENV